MILEDADKLLISCGQEYVTEYQLLVRCLSEQTIAVSYTHLDVYKRQVKNLEFSPIKGPEGNIEYLLYLNNKEEDPCVQPPVAPDEIVELAHAALQG